MRISDWSSDVCSSDLVERVDEREIDTVFGAFKLVTYRDRIAHELHFALVCGRPDPDTPTLVRVHVKNLLSDVLHWQRPDFGVALNDALAAIAKAGTGVLVVLADPVTPEIVLERLRAPVAVHDADSDGHDGAGQGSVHWRRNGAGAQILADLGLRCLRVLGTPRRQVGLAGFGLEVVEFVDLGQAASA